ncbi:hypothetical protein CCM_06236 [Cordyceps militaris CM01]|uniref:Uncharacterized protein n=1 Tax=Cordyceps militaris (strain CM01) TaxID=983644 RepID=G3JJI8_CORMM|nr:uncharacterized protein CCM_06236 [Cordyceps militaris CM01]EGX92076.1 hypothetical protein CCM_06236 [Cordyceps militaris CM01]
MSLLAHGSPHNVTSTISQTPFCLSHRDQTRSESAPCLPHTWGRHWPSIWPLVHNYLQIRYMPILRFAPVPRPGTRGHTILVLLDDTRYHSALAPPPRRSFRETPVSSPDRLREHMTLSNFRECYIGESHKRVPSASLEKPVWFIHRRLWKCFWLFIVRCLALANTPPRPIIIVYIPCDKTHLKLLAQCTKKAVPPRRGLRRDALT